MRFFRLLLAFFIIFSCGALSIYANSPLLTRYDVVNKTKKILSMHACYSDFSEEIAERTLKNFIQFLDPKKIYFLEEEIAKWIHPKKSLLNRIKEGFSKNNFDLLKPIYLLFQKNIERHNAIIAKLSIENIIKDSPPDNTLKPLSWCANQGALEERIHQILTIQIKAICAARSDMSKENAFLLLQKSEAAGHNLFIETSTAKNTFYTYILKSIALSLDAHTMYFTPVEVRQLLVSMQQRIFGIGAQFQEDIDGFSIVKIVPGSPADKKLKIGDRVIAVDNEPTVGITVSRFIDLVRGKENTQMVLLVASKQRRKPKKVRISRREIIIEETRVRPNVMPFADGVILSFSIPTFYQTSKFSTVKDIKEQLSRLKQEHNVLGVILDLRSNLGGLLTEAVGVVDLFINKGIVATIEDREKNRLHFRSEGGKIWSGPLFVLVNSLSASASEIVAQTLQDYGRGFVVGDARTFGKGTFQSLTLDMHRGEYQEDQGELKVTRGFYFTPSGKSPQEKGVEPDFTVPGPLSLLEVGERYLNYPLPNKSIHPNFDDKYEDLNFFQRLEKGLSFKKRQKVEKKIQPFKVPLEGNSKERMSTNRFFQLLLNNNQVGITEEKAEIDFQLDETVNIMRDFIVFLQTGKETIK